SAPSAKPSAPSAKPPAPSAKPSAPSAKPSAPSYRDLQRNRRHVVVWRRIAAEGPHGAEDGVHDRSRRLIAGFLHHLDQALGAELAAETVVRLEHAVRAEDVRVAGSELEGHFVVRRSGKRAERHAGQFNLRGPLRRGVIANWIRKARVGEEHAA